MLPSKYCLNPSLPGVVCQNHFYRSDILSFISLNTRYDYAIIVIFECCIYRNSKKYSINPILLEKLSVDGPIEETTSLPLTYSKQQVLSTDVCEQVVSVCGVLLPKHNNQKSEQVSLITGI